MHLCLCMCCINYACDDLSCHVVKVRLEVPKPSAIDDLPPLCEAITEADYVRFVLQPDQQVSC